MDKVSTKIYCHFYLRGIALSSHLIYVESCKRADCMSGYGALHKLRLISVLSAACVIRELVRLYLHLYRKFASLMQEAACVIRGLFCHINGSIVSRCAKAEIYSSLLQTVSCD